MTKRTVVAMSGWLGIAILAASPALPVQNLAPNAEFDTDTPPWYVSTLIVNSTIGWTNVDHGGCASSISGAGLATSFATPAGQGGGTAVCITGFVPGQTYSFGADLRFPPGQDRTGSAMIRLVGLASSDCSGLSRMTWDSENSLTTSTTGTWVRIRGAVVASADDGSVALAVRLVKTEANGTLDLEVDGAYFVPGEGFVFGDGFERQSTCHWSSIGP